MSAILRSAGVSTRAFYRHFGSKDELFLALLREEGDALAARVDRIAEEAVGTPANQLAAWIGEMFEVIVEPVHQLQLMVIDSDEVRMAKGYRETRERSHADRERSLVEILGTRPARRLIPAHRSGLRCHRDQRGRQPRDGHAGA